MATAARKTAAPLRTSEATAIITIICCNSMHRAAAARPRTRTAANSFSRVSTSTGASCHRNRSSVTSSTS
uniref:Putative secreted peptide n=1 Tax=Anopheles braziliensis TaxID=58242 RepID=A0A2M3ZUG5_9DIPT